MDKAQVNYVRVSFKASSFQIIEKDGNWDFTGTILLFSLTRFTISTEKFTAVSVYLLTSTSIGDTTAISTKGRILFFFFFLTYLIEISGTSKNSSFITWNELG